MKKKIIGIFVCMLLIATALSATGIKTFNEYPTDKNTIKVGVNGDWDEITRLISSDGEPDDWFGESVDIDEDYAIIGARLDDDNGNASGSAYIFKNNNGSWIQEEKLIASNGSEYDGFGCSVSIDDDYAIVGAFGRPGQVYIFERSMSGWVEVANFVGSSDGGLGLSVSISRDYAFAGDPRAKVDGYPQCGMVSVYHRTGSANWEQINTILPNTPGSYLYFGFSVSVDGDFAVIGVPGADIDEINDGAAFICKRFSTGWGKHRLLTTPYGGELNSAFGDITSIYGDYVLIKNDYEKVFGFVRDGDDWIFENAINFTADNQLDDISMCIYEDLCVFGFSWNDSYTGKAEIYRWIPDQGFDFEAQIKASDGDLDDYFGHSISIYGEYVLVGAPYDDNNNGEKAGSTYVFKKPTASICCEGELVWEKEKPGSIVNGTFHVSNCGEASSLLNWEVDTYPSWGTWTFDPDSGENLTPEDGTITVNVTITAPDEQNSEFDGEIKIINKENSSDFCTIDVSLTTPKNKLFVFNFPLLNWLFERYPNAFPILRNIIEL